jgi:hypothetical protein
VPPYLSNHSCRSFPTQTLLWHLLRPVGKDYSADHSWLFYHFEVLNLASLPKEFKNKKLLDEITPIISEALDEAKWEEQFQRSGSKLVAIAEAVKDQLSRAAVNRHFS